MITINFTFESEYALFSDALNLEDDHTFTNQEIEDMKQQRFNTWLSLFTPGPPDVEE